MNKIAFITLKFAGIALIISAFIDNIFTLRVANVEADMLTLVLGLLVLTNSWIVARNFSKPKS